MISQEFLNLHVWLVLIHVLVCTLLEWDLQMLCWLTFHILQRFLTCKDNFISSVFDVEPAGCYLLMFCICQYLVCIRLIRHMTFLHLFIPNILNPIMLVFSQCMIIPNVSIIEADIFNDFGISLSNWKYHICFIKFLLVFDY